MASVREPALHAYDQEAREARSDWRQPKYRRCKRDPLQHRKSSSCRFSMSQLPSRRAKAVKRCPKAEQLADQLRKLDLFNMTPMQAMQWLNDMKLKLN